MVALRLWVRFIVNIDHYPPICIRMYIYIGAQIEPRKLTAGTVIIFSPGIYYVDQSSRYTDCGFLQQKIPCQSLWSHYGNVKFNSGKSSLFSSVSPDGWRE